MSSAKPSSGSATRNTRGMNSHAFRHAAALAKEGATADESDIKLPKSKKAPIPPLGASPDRLAVAGSKSIDSLELNSPFPSPRDDQDLKLKGGTPTDHFALAMHHVCTALSQLLQMLCLTIFPCCAPGGTERGGSPKKQAVADDEDDDEEEVLRKTVHAAGVILPTDPWKEMWDLYILMFIIYSAITVPYRICFEAAADGIMWYFEQAVTVLFFVDVVFNFKTAIPNTAEQAREQWVYDKLEIAKVYMSGWFWIDFPSCIPVELIDIMMEGEQSQMGLLRFLRLFRLIRLLRLLKVGEYIASLEEKFDVNLTFLRIATMLLKLCFLSHILACFWFYTAALTGINEETRTWVSEYDDGSAMYAEPHVQYLYSMYWALTTLTTVGYGDIVPVNNTERYYALFALLIGAIVFGYMLSSIGSLVSALDRQAALSEEKMDAIKEYMRWRRLPRDLTIRMRRYYEYYYDKKTAFDEIAILEGLTPPLRSEVVRHSLKETIGRIPLFRRTLDPMFQMEIFPLFQPVSTATREIIYCKGDASQGLYFLLKGRLEAISCIESRVLYSVKQGQSFGESVLTGRKRSETMRSQTACDLFTISKDALQDLFSRRPREGRLMHQALLREHLRKEKMRALSLRIVMNKLLVEGSQEPLTEETEQLIAALKMQLVWARFTESYVMKNMPTKEEPEKLSVNEAVSENCVLPTGIEAPPGSPAASRAGAAEPTRHWSSAGETNAGRSWSTDVADRGSVQAVHQDLRRMLGEVAEMHDAQRRMQQQILAIGTLQQVNGQTSPPTSPPTQPPAPPPPAPASHQFVI